MPAHFDAAAFRAGLHRARAIRAAGDQCDKCGWLAWSYARQDQLELREVEGAKRPRVLCPTCVAEHDRKASARRGSRQAAA